MRKEIGALLPLDSSYPKPLEKADCLSQKSCRELFRKTGGLFLGIQFLHGLEQRVPARGSEMEHQPDVSALAVWANHLTSRFSVTVCKMEMLLLEGRWPIRRSPLVPLARRSVIPGNWLVQWKEQGGPLLSRRLGSESQLCHLHPV